MSSLNFDVGIQPGPSALGGSIMDNKENMAPSTFVLFVYIGMVMLVMILCSWGHQGVAGNSSSMGLAMAVSGWGK